MSDGVLDLTRPTRPKVLIASPHTGQGHIAFMQSVMAIYAKTSPDTCLMRWEGCSGSNIAENQNTLVDCAQEKGVDYILFVETDMAFPGEALTWLLAHGKDIVGCSYPFKDHDLLAKNLADQKANLRYMGHEEDGSNITFRTLVEGESLRKVEFVPMGLTLISMKAIEAVQAYRATQADPPPPEGIRMCAFRHAEVVMPGYKRTAAATTDSTFCNDARAAGLDIWLDARLSLLVEHIGQSNFSMLPETYLPKEMLEPAA